jgi:hypothetical protein
MPGSFRAATTSWRAASRAIVCTAMASSRPRLRFSPAVSFFRLPSSPRPQVGPTSSCRCGEGSAGCCLDGRQPASPAAPQNEPACHSRSERPGNRIPDTAARRERVSALYSYFPQEIAMLRG